MILGSDSRVSSATSATSRSTFVMPRKPLKSLNNNKTSQMNRLLTLILALSFSLPLFAQEGPSNCVAAPYPLEVTQPDGSTLTIIGKGNHYLSYSETVDGYTVIQNEKGYWEYATQDQDGRLKASAVLASNPEQRNVLEEAFLQKVPQQLRHSNEVEATLRARFTEPQRMQTGARSSGMAESFPSLGSHKILLVLIEYPNLKSRYSTSDFQDLMNEEDYNGTGSFRDYYKAVSNNQLDVQVDVAGWYTASNNFQYYGKSQNDYGDRVRQLVAQAVDSADADGIDFSQYDNDNDGEVDGIFVVHAGLGAEEGSQTQYVWSHRWHLSGYERFNDGVWVRDYIINPETRANNTRMVGIGVFCHEFGHLLQLPDLYDTQESNGSSSGIGQWGLMGGGSWLNRERTPAMMSAWSRETLGWIHPQEITSTGVYTLKPASSSHECYKISTSNPNEYFLLENRQRDGFDAAIPGHGLAIWHIDATKTTLYPGDNVVNGDETRKGVDLEEADGRLDMDNGSSNGDGSDLFPGFSMRTSFNDNTAPNSRLYDGTGTGIQVNNILELNDSSISFQFGELPFAQFAPSEVDICKGEEVHFTNSSLFSDSFYWDFGSGVTSQATNTSFTFQNEGNYFVKLTVKNVDGFAHTDSVLIRVHNDPVAEFEWENEEMEVSFTNSSVMGASFSWDFGDGNTSTLPYPTHTYQSNGSYTVSLKAKSTFGCEDDIQKQVTLNVVGMADPKAVALQALPNPFGSQLQVSYHLQQQQQVQASLHNVIGQQVFSSRFTKGMGDHQLVIPTQDLQPGIYLLHLEVGGQQVHTLKVLKE